MKFINTTAVVKIPEGVDLFLKSRNVKVRGPRGMLKRNFRHAKLDMTYNGEGRELKITQWFGRKKDTCVVQTIASHVENLITGVTKGYRIKMKAVYNHFPINISIADDSKSIEIRNFVGQKRERRVEMLDGVTVQKSTQKDEIILEGNDLENVSLCAAKIHQCVLVREKDIRMFLDGVYVSEVENIDN